ncbi:cobyrinic acid ac-diamide synthase [Massilia sp. YIM B04103]|uniref:cobyrinic acid ac-diamide synthase n=1 Tax=Massilia sp. YIM B04103 TaxID=2963106 RepID=UPI00210D63AC|nr:cobyrinic acid ac-diamide synthase [Massilia sp. YIM B04103]
MIIAIAGQNPGSAKDIVASSLALLRARSGRKVLLLDTDPRQACAALSCEQAGAVPASRAAKPARLAARAIHGRALQDELEILRCRYNDIVIDTEGRDTAESRAALIAARIAVVPVAPDQVDLATQYKLIARLNSARMFNPGLRVLFVVLGGQSDPDSVQMAAVRAYVSRVMAANLSGTVIHLPAQGEHAEAEMAALYQEVFAS